MHNQMQKFKIIVVLTLSIFVLNLSAPAIAAATEIGFSKVNENLLDIEKTDAKTENNDQINNEEAAKEKAAGTNAGFEPIEEKLGEEVQAKESLATNNDEAIDSSIDSEEAALESIPSDDGIALMAADGNTLKNWQDEILDAKNSSLYNMELNAPYTKESSGIREDISPENGALSLTNTIFNIPGRNGMDLSLSITYNNNTATMGSISKIV